MQEELPRGCCRGTPALRRCKVKAAREPEQKCTKHTGLSFSSLSSRCLVVPLTVQRQAEAESKETEGYIPQGLALWGQSRVEDDGGEVKWRITYRSAK